MYDYIIATDEGGRGEEDEEEGVEEDVEDATAEDPEQGDEDVQREELGSDDDCMFSIYPIQYFPNFK